MDYEEVCITNGNVFVNHEDNKLRNLSQQQLEKNLFWEVSYPSFGIQFFFQGKLI